MTTSHEVVFLFDVDNTLLDNDRIEKNLRGHLETMLRRLRNEIWAWNFKLFAFLITPNTFLRKTIEHNSVPGFQNCQPTREAKNTLDKGHCTVGMNSAN